MNRLKNALVYLNRLIKREIDYALVRPTHALLFLTYRCTSKCKMCTIWKRSETTDWQKELTLEEWKSCIDMLCAENIEVIELFGGDALLRKDVLIPLIRYIRKKNENIIIDFPTNCNLLDNETAEELVDAGVTRLYVSLDGPNGIHDKIRGIEGAFENVDRGLKYLVQAKERKRKREPQIICNCTISSLNVGHFEKIIPYVKNMGVDCVEFEYVGEIKEESIQKTNINGLKPTPFYVSQDQSILLNREQALLLKQKMKQIRELSRANSNHLATQHIDVLTVDNLINGTIPNKKCYICRYMVSIDPFGNVMGCFHFNNYHLGNIREEPLKLIWNNKMHRDFINFQREGKINICKDCISGVHRNTTLFQSIARKIYLSFRSNN